MSTVTYKWYKIYLLKPYDHVDMVLEMHLEL